jgi:hypothetical protein
VVENLDLDPASLALDIVLVGCFETLGGEKPYELLLDTYFFNQPIFSTF